MRVAAPRWPARGSWWYTTRLTAHPVCWPLSCLQLEIGYDSFIRTTDAKHEALVCQVGAQAADPAVPACLLPSSCMDRGTGLQL